MEPFCREHPLSAGGLLPLYGEQTQSNRLSYPSSGPPLGWPVFPTVGRGDIFHFSIRLE